MARPIGAVILTGPYRTVTTFGEAMDLVRGVSRAKGARIRCRLMRTPSTTWLDLYLDQA